MHKISIHYFVLKKEHAPRAPPLDHPGLLPLIQHRLSWKVRVCTVKEGTVFSIVYKVVSLVLCTIILLNSFCLCLHSRTCYTKQIFSTPVGLKSMTVAS